MENKVTVTFETFGGTVIKPIKVNIGTPVQDVIPSIIPEKAEHGFEGWFLNSSLTNKAADFLATEIAEDVTIYAKFNWYYPFEVSNIKHSYEKEKFLSTFSWNNPKDENFSHVNFSYLGATILLNEQCSISASPPYMSPLVFKCVDKNGNFSKGITYIAEEAKVNPFN